MGDPATAGDFDEASILADAREKAALRDFGDDPFLEPLRVLLRSLDLEAGLNAVGRATQRARIVDSLVVRLAAQDYFRRHPEILDEKLESPIVVLGPTRSGTTMLQRLLSSDPRHHAVLWWEVRNPAPFPGSDWRTRDPRIEDAHEQVRLILETVPQLAAIHPWDPEGPDEDIMLLEHAFLSQVPESSAHLPSYMAWLDEQDLKPAYEYLAKLLKFLQWQKKERGERGERWVLKTPMHLGYLNVLFDVFPDARIVQTHRDPLTTIPSAASMYTALWELNADEVDRLAVGRQVSRRIRWNMERCLRARASMPRDRFFDVWYEDLQRDPMEQIRRIYGWLGRDLEAEAEAAMRTWLVENAREKRAPHEYTLEEFGFEAEGLARDFENYRERFILHRPSASD